VNWKNSQSTSTATIEIAIVLTSWRENATPPTW
jgi:hypothetical protein